MMSRSRSDVTSLRSVSSASQYSGREKPPPSAATCSLITMLERKSSWRARWIRSRRSRISDSVSSACSTV